MTIILFLVDTSSSMCQKAYVNGVQKTYLDIAKGAVETFLKYRQRTQDCLGDRYMLLTFEEPPANVKAGWKENHATFMNELKNLQSHGLTSMGESLRNAFDLLNLNRMQSGIDTYGQGRCPFYLEPSVIIVITDGGRYSYRNGVHQEIILPLSNQIPGTKFTKEPFRWDQRLFSLVLRMPGNKIDERVEGKVPHDDSPIERMCEVTGGRSYRVRSHHVLNQCIESLVQKVQPGVVLQFEPLMPKDSSSGASGTPAANSNTSGGGGGSGGGSGSGTGTGQNDPPPDIVFQPVKKMIYVQKHITQKTFPIGYWPLPEPYWPDSKAITLPPRDAHPKLKVLTPAVDEPQLVRSFPVDKYEIEGCPLTLQILNKREMNKCWQVIVTNGMHGFELPFGYLKAAPNFSQVHLYVLAYNYPALLPLLHDLIHKYNMSPPNDLMYKFNAYVRSIPPYYCPFLRKALVNINVPYQLLQFLLPDNVDNYLSPTIANQLKHIKNTAKQDQENLCLKVYKQLKQPKPPYRQVETAKLCSGTALRRDLVRHPLLRDTFAKLHAEIEPVENYTIVVPQLSHQSSAKTYRNPFDIPRRDLVEEIARMRESFLRPASLVAKDSGHCLPIAEMGNYQEYLKNKDNPLREIEPTNVRQHMFGNPYKKDKHMVMVDEADLSDVAPMKSSPSSNGGGPGGGGGGGAGGSSPGGGPSSSSAAASGSPTGPGQVGGGSPGMGPGGPGMPGLMLAAGGNSSSKKLDGTSRGRKRKAGPLPRGFEFRRLSTDSRPSSPVPSLSGSEDSCSSVGSSSVGGGAGSGGANSLDASGSSTSAAIVAISSTSSNVSDSLNCDSSQDSVMSCSDDDSPSSSTSSVSNSEAVSGSDSGMSSTDRLGMSFDFSEEEPSDQDSALNGYVHNFINGIGDEVHSGEVESAATAQATSEGGGGTGGTTATTTQATGSAAATATAHASASNGEPISSSSSRGGTVSASSSNNSSGVFYVPLNGLTTHAAYSSNVGGGAASLDLPGSTTTGGILRTHPNTLPLGMANGYGHSVATSGIHSPPSPLPTAMGTTSSSLTTAASTSASSSTSSSSSSSSYFSHNDINDASEISRILQTCHNGGATSSNSNSSSSSSTATLNGLNDGHANDTEPHGFDALKRGNALGGGGTTLLGASSGGIGGGAAAATMGGGNHPHFYWASGLNHQSSNHQGNNINHNNNNNNNNNHRSHNNNSPKLELKSISPTNNGESTSSSTSSSSSSSLNNNNRKRSSSRGRSNSPAVAAAAGASNITNNHHHHLQLTDEQREAARKHNIDLRLQIFRDIRRPGRDYSQLLEHLNLVKGDHEMKSDFIDMCIGESMRFRRHQMVNSIQDWWDNKQQQEHVSAVLENGAAEKAGIKKGDRILEV
ncbi:uncharacterized protein Dwil_GK10234 [Drosophila willistoni]|uniref:VWFA domain-containing protein n=1 Tax=Drosophila willistoni TaxID=7260 RepID=B4NDG6_DROWI|nr:uncharacterized protein Dwil_GK10234 [Drosophila willistoni]